MAEWLILCSDDVRILAKQHYPFAKPDADVENRARPNLTE
jgi:hypothetical protein